mmetsp:Transcript_14404/g.24564  ORF Transcript_14404/g.24564 Transcript_14404/m.24564 type:complete len:113 (+) Transcript_14404:42-380(+)
MDEQTKHSEFAESESLSSGTLPACSFIEQTADSTEPGASRCPLEHECWYRTAYEESAQQVERYKSLVGEKTRQFEEEMQRREAEFAQVTQFQVAEVRRLTQHLEKIKSMIQS